MVESEIGLPTTPSLSFFETPELPMNHAIVPLSNIATVKRGIQTGANEFFCLTQSEVEAYDLPDEVLSPLLKSTRRAPHYAYRTADWRADQADDVACWLLYHTADLDRPASDAVEQYLTSAEADGLPEEYYTLRNRDPWYVVDRRAPPDIIFTYMSRGGMRFILNVAEARALNNTHGIWLNEGFSLVEKLAVMGYLNSPMVDEWLSRKGPKYVEGLDKVEPNTLKQLPVPHPGYLPHEVCERLGKQFHALDEASREGSSLEARRTRLADTVKTWYAAEVHRQLDRALEQYANETSCAYWEPPVPKRKRTTRSD